MTDISPPRAGEQTSTGNTGNTLQVGGNVNAPINLLFNARLIPAHPVPEADLNAVLHAWAQTRTADQAEAALASHGIAAITGPRGGGRRTSALRALLSVRDRPVYVLSPDWDEDEVPSLDTLPSNSRSGYLLSTGNLKLTEKAASVLLSYGDRLRRQGSAIVVVTSPDAWPTSSVATADVAVHAIPPRPIEVVARHLNYLDMAARISWVQTPDRAGVFGTKQGASAPLADLIDGIDPSAAARLARIIAAADENAYERVRNEFTGWEKDLYERLSAGPGNARDRVLLVTVALLEGADVNTIYEASRALTNLDRVEATRRVLSGAGFMPRLQQIHADSSSQGVRFEGRPGYGAAALRHVWRNRLEFRDDLVKWVKAITEEDNPGAPYVRHIGKQLVVLAQTEEEVPLTEIVATWFKHRPKESADVLSEAAVDREAGRGVRAQLLAWAKGADPAARRVVAQVCGGQFADVYPRMALTRLKWVLDREQSDVATEAAGVSLSNIARQGSDNRLGVLQALAQWAESHPDKLAAPRGFLDLFATAGEAPALLRDVIEDAVHDKALADLLADMWADALTRPQLTEQAYNALRLWADHAHAGEIPDGPTMEILRTAIIRHTPTDAASQFLFGDSADGDALRWARQHLAAPGACIHLPNCPVCNPVPHEAETP